MSPLAPVRKAVVPAAGLGTRFLPATKAVPKEMLPIVDKPVIQYVVEEAAASGIDDIVIITARGKEAIEAHFTPQPGLEDMLVNLGRTAEAEALRDITKLARISFILQDEPRGNGHAVLCAREAIGDAPFAMIFGDDLVDAAIPCIQQLIDVYHRFGGSVAAVMPVPDAQVSRYGVIDGEPLGEGVYRVRSVVEKPAVGHAPSNLAAVHAWILVPRIFALLADTPPGRDGEIWLVDAIQRLAEEQPVYALEFDGQRYDVGDKLGLIEASLDFGLKRPDIGPLLASRLAERLPG